ncbi:MAG: D-aminoacyl-tRNA deacylase [Eubacteriales bacterium]|nr:D-aminoacyl-tRNA deacylase [Eubacteriales bacterium]
MIAVIERVSRASVTVDGRITGCIGKGLLVLLGVEQGDGDSDLAYIVNKTAGLRIFQSEGKMTLSVMDIGGEIIVVSQFTLLGDARHGKRPDFTKAADAGHAQMMYEKCIAAFADMGLGTAAGEFGTHMCVDMSGDGPVTILLDSKRKF